MKPIIRMSLMYGVVFLPNGQYIVTNDDTSGTVVQTGANTTRTIDPYGNQQVQIQNQREVYNYPVYQAPQPTYQQPNYQNNAPDYRMKKFDFGQ